MVPVGFPPSPPAPINVSVAKICVWFGREEKRQTIIFFNLFSEIKQFHLRPFSVILQRTATREKNCVWFGKTVQRNPPTHCGLFSRHCYTPRIECRHPDRSERVCRCTKVRFSSSFFDVSEIKPEFFTNVNLNSNAQLLLHFHVIPQIFGFGLFFLFGFGLPWWLAAHRAHAGGRIPPWRPNHPAAVAGQGRGGAG